MDPNFDFNLDSPNNALTGAFTAPELHHAQPAVYGTMNHNTSPVNLWQDQSYANEPFDPTPPPPAQDGHFLWSLCAQFIDRGYTIEGIDKANAWHTMMQPAVLRKRTNKAMWDLRDILHAYVRKIGDDLGAGESADLGVISRNHLPMSNNYEQMASYAQSQQGNGMSSTRDNQREPGTAGRSMLRPSPQLEPSSSTPQSATANAALALRMATSCHTDSGSNQPEQTQNHVEPYRGLPQKRPHTGPAEAPNKRPDQSPPGTYLATPGISPPFRHNFPFGVAPRAQENPVEVPVSSVSCTGVKKGRAQQEGTFPCPYCNINPFIREQNLKNHLVLKHPRHHTAAAPSIQSTGAPLDTLEGSPKPAFAMEGQDSFLAANPPDGVGGMIGMSNEIMRG